MVLVSVGQHDVAERIHAHFGQGLPYPLIVDSGVNDQTVAAYVVHYEITVCAKVSEYELGD